MGTPYIGEIRMFAGNFAPAGWAFCNGQLIPISENDTLFNLIGTTYGGDGQSTFALPNLQSRVPIHMGTGGGSTYVIGQLAGEAQVTLTVNQIPLHSHVPQAQTGGGSQSSPGNGLWATSSDNRYSANSPTAAMNALDTQMTGGSQPHDNMIPFVCINFIIPLFEVYPSPN